MKCCNRSGKTTIECSLKGEKMNFILIEYKVYLCCIIFEKVMSVGKREIGDAN